MAKLFNLARMTTATTGTGVITLGAAVPGYLTFAQAGVSNGDIISYGIKDGNNSEVGIGTYSTAGPTLTRTVRKSTNSNAAITLSGAAEVFITPLAEDMYVNTNILGTVSQSSGVPTGAIVERGSNANGEYVRFADGTQICWRSVTIPGGAQAASGSGSGTWPASFVSNAVRVIYNVNTAQGGGSQVSTSEVYRNSIWITVNFGAVNFNTFRYAVAQANAVDYDVVGIGRWF